MQPYSARSTPIEIPYRGMSTRYPLARMPPQFAPWIEGYQLGPGFLESPKGIAYKFDGQAGPVGGFAPDPDDPEEIVQFSQGGTFTARPYNVFTETEGSTATGGTGAGERVFSISFGDNIIAFQNGQDPHTWSGSTLAAMTFTGPTLDNLIGGTSYRSQLYVFEKNSTSVWFRDSVGTITGAMTEYDTNLISKNRGYVRSVFTFTLSSGLDSQELWAVALDSGEVIVASGVDPADTTWTIVGRAIIGRPLGYNNFIEKDGDVLLLTSRGVVSMRQTFLSQDASASIPMISDEIEKYWSQLVQDIEAFEGAASYAPQTALSSYIRGVYHQRENRIYIFCPRTLSPYTSETGDFGYQLTAGTMILIYDFNYQGWVARRFNSTSQVPGSASNQICAAYYEPRTESIFIASNFPSTNAVWRLKGNSRYSDNYAAVSTSNTGATAGTAFDSIELEGNTDSWTSESNAGASDNSYATYSNSSNATPYLMANTFGFAVPTGATIVEIGITAEFKSASGKVGSIYGSYTLDAGATIEATLIDTTYLVSGFPTSDTSITLGGAGSGFGAGLTPAQVNSADFGVLFGFAAEDDFSVDLITCTVYYTESIDDADADIPLKIISAPISGEDKKASVKSWRLLHSGDAEAKSALVIQTQADIASQLSAGDQHTLSAGVSKDRYNTGLTADLIQHIISTHTGPSDDRPHKILSISPVIELGGEAG